jgi:hypothetical protein
LLNQCRFCSRRRRVVMLASYKYVTLNQMDHESNTPQHNVGMVLDHPFPVAQYIYAEPSTLDAAIRTSGWTLDFTLPERQ